MAWPASWVAMARRSPIGVSDGLGQAEFLGHAGLLDVGPVHRGPTAPQRPDQRFVQKVLEHDR